MDTLPASSVAKVVLTYIVVVHGVNSLVVVNVSETDRTVIWNNTAKTNCSWLETVQTIPDIKGYFQFTADWSQLVLQKMLDLEVLKDYTPIQTISIKLECQGVSTQITINIIAENEFAPEFLSAPFSTSVHEGALNGTEIFSLERRVRDKDAFQYNNIVSYNVLPFQIEQYDGRTHFSLDNETGVVTTKLDLDYEQLKYGYYILRFNAFDDGGLSAETTLNITIVDIDDMPPEFVVRGCYECTQIESYSKTIDIHAMGPLQGLQPAELHARDGDRGVKASIIYTIYNDTYDDLADNLVINESTGALEVLTPYMNITGDMLDTLPEPFTTTITIIATERSNISKSTNASFTLIIYRVLPNDRTTPSTTPTPPGSSTVTRVKDVDDNSSLLLIEIIVPCTLAILIVVVIVVLFLKKRQKRKEMKYRVKENDKRVSKTGGDMMDSLPATMATPYDLVGAYAHIDLGAYDRDGFQDTSNTPAVAMGMAAEEYAAVLSDSNDGMYAKVKKKAPRAMKLRAVDIVEAESGGGEEEFGRKGSYNVKSAGVTRDTAEVLEEGGGGDDDYASVGTMSNNTEGLRENLGYDDRDDSNSN